MVRSNQEQGLFDGQSRDRAHGLNFFAHYMTLAIHRLGVALTVGAALPASVEAQASREGPACPVAAEQLPQLAPFEARTGSLGPGEAKCFELFLQDGEFIRISVDIEAGYARVQAFGPYDDHRFQVRWVRPDSAEYTAPRLAALAFQASTSGRYVVELSIPVGIGQPVPVFKVQVAEYRSAGIQAAIREDLRTDSRTAWLREHAQRIRSIDPEDGDFSDLQFLRKQLRGVRVVLLGEADHGDGSDFTAKTRLVKFLHRQMGFDVLAFEGELFGTRVAWRALQTGAEPRAAFSQGAYPIWAMSEQVQPLIRYVAASARSAHPLELTAFDIVGVGRFSASRDSLLPNLREFLTRTGVGGPLADLESTPSWILARTYGGRSGRDRQQSPTPAEQAEFLESLRTTAAQVERSHSGRDALFWAQLLRSTSVTARYYLDYPSQDAELIRDRQMADNLLWLVNRYYRGRKIIVWAHTGHVMRNPQHTVSGRKQGFTMGQGLWEALRRESFAVGFVSYTGTARFANQPEEQQQSLVPDQHPAFEFEELMDAAGHELAWVNLREARGRQQWPGGAFLARPLFHISEHAPWSEVLDALFFIRTQEASRRVARVR
ncbi:MAG TPA: erythromycin esterase family protein [Gemmatimonadaceae bacterium]|nr:erythromycin esterase family protein [Gemmatimonadaceae bacterium]